jgi:hypothetical protein
MDPYLAKPGNVADRHLSNGEMRTEGGDLPEG